MKHRSINQTLFIELFGTALIVFFVVFSAELFQRKAINQKITKIKKSRIQEFIHKDRETISIQMALGMQEDLNHYVTNLKNIFENTDFCFRSKNSPIEKVGSCSLFGPNSQGIDLGDFTAFFAIETESLPGTITAIFNNHYFILVLTIFFSITLVIFFRLKKHIARPIQRLVVAFDNYLHGQRTKISLETEIEELRKLTQQINGFAEYLENLEISAKEQSTNKTSKKIAHDIRSPLSALNLVLKKANLTDLERDLAFDSIERIDGISNELLQKNHVETSSKDPTTDLFIAAEKIVREKKVISKNKNISFSIDGEKGVYFSEVSQPKIEAVLSNLVQNSIEAFDGNIGLITISLGSNKNNHVVRVMDNGKGIGQTEQKSLFRQGFSHGKDDGHGIGLASAKDLVVREGGTISVHSEEFVGTSFQIELPKVIFPINQRPNLKLARN